ncbi:MAG TPA: hypothetical protein GX503_07975 [Clostridiales bacterium]|nr:hypothetical protein [Clostridiales bacterium]
MKSEPKTGKFNLPAFIYYLFRDEIDNTYGMFLKILCAWVRFMGDGCGGLTEKGKQSIDFQCFIA